MDCFVECARNYQLSGAPLQEMCEHNAEFAERYNNDQVILKKISVYFLCVYNRCIFRDFKLTA